MMSSAEVSIHTRQKTKEISDKKNPRDQMGTIINLIQWSGKLNKWSERSCHEGSDVH